MNLYIDEHYDDENNRTVLALLRITERDVISVYKNIKKIIIRKESDPKTKQLLFNELKANKLNNKRYWGDILNEIYKVTSLQQYIVLSCQPKDKENFQTQYADAIKKILNNEDIKIFADKINSKSFMTPIIDKINDSRFEFCNSVLNKGVQLADLIASTYKGRIIDKMEDSEPSLNVHFHTNSEELICKIKELLEDDV